MAVAAPRATALPTLVVVVAGVALSGQAYINGRLGESIGSGEAAAAVNNGVGLAALLVVTVAAGAVPRALRSLSQVRFWHLLGGLGGAMFIAAGAIGAPEIGVALLSLALVCGQTTGSLVADGAGLSPAGRQGVTAGRVAGVLLTIAAVVASALGASANLQVGLLAFALAAGAASALQQAANGHLARNTGEPLFAGTVNFAVGFLALLVVAAIATGLAPPHGWSAPPLEYTAGLLGAAIATTTAVLVSRLGVLRLMLALTAGQAIGGLALDLIAPARGATVTLGTVAGVVLTCVAVLVSGRGTRSPT
ncbi:MAG TPA: DMT family transporter [Solirubrobacteraceae bacterium]|nr:DMT family transporter [Solirubrobacteraceae bacterium]